MYPLSLTNRQRLLGVLVTLVLVFTGWAPVFVRAVSPPNIVTYQGRLLDANGVPATASSATMIFELYTDPTAGSCVWSNSSSTCASATARTVTLTDGLFSENLGDTGASPAYAAINDSTFADNAALYLRVTVNGEALSPRKRLTASPYALNAENVDGYDTSLTGGTSSFVPVTSSSGNLTLTGDPTGSTVSTGVIYINPSTVSAGETLFGIAVAGSERFRLNNDADITMTGSITLSDEMETVTISDIVLSGDGVESTNNLLELDGFTGLNLNTVNNANIATGTGTFTSNGGTILGNDSSDTLTVNAVLQGTSALSFEGSVADAFETFFSITNPTADRTITFQDATGTVAYLSDLVGSTITLDTAYDAGGSGAGRTITADSGAVTISATSLGGNALLSAAHTASGTLTANTTDTTSMSASRTLSSAATVTDNFNVLNLSRTSVTSNGSANLTATGAVLSLSNTATQTSGTLTDSVNVLEIEQASTSTGFALLVNSGSSALNGSLRLGVTSFTESIADPAFDFDEGTLYVDDFAGFNDDVYMDEQLNVDGHSTFGASAAQSTLQVVTVGESLACTNSDCLGVITAITDTDSSGTGDVIAGGFSSISSVGTASASSDVIGVNGSALLNGSVTYNGRVIGARGAVARQSSGNPTFTSAFGVLGDMTLSNISDVTGSASGVHSIVTLATNQSITGSTSLYSGALTQSNGTFTTFNGLNLTLQPTTGTITNANGGVFSIVPEAGATIGTMKGVSINVDPGTATISGATVTGLEITADGDDGVGDDVGTVYGANIAATNGTTGTTTAYGVYATASGADTNYSGYFFGSLFQVDGDGTPDTNNTLASGAGSLYVTNDLEVDDDLLVNSHAAFGGSASVNDFAVVTATESIGCTSDCSLVRGTLTNTTANFTTNVAGGSFVVNTAQDSGAGGGLIGVSGSVTTTGTPTLDDDPVVGVRGSFSVTSGSPVTIQDLRGVMGSIVLDDVGEIGNMATGVGSFVTLTDATTSIAVGDVDLYLGTLTLTGGTLATVNGLALGMDSAMTGGTITSLNGLDVNISLAGTTVTNPRGGVITVAPGTGTFGGNTTGLTVDVSGNNSSGTDRTVFGLDVDASTSTTGGPTTAYGVYATASGATTNYSGYFYGNPFFVDDDTTPNTPNITMGAGDIYAASDIEADGIIRADGGQIRVSNTTGGSQFNASTAAVGAFALLSLSGVDGGSAAGNWQMYTASGSASISNGARNDLRWTTDGVVSSDDDEMRLTTAGELFLDTGVGVGAADVAEVYTVSDPALTEGDIVGLTTVGGIVRADATTVLFGAVSTRPGVTLNNGEDDTFESDERKIALVGRVPVKVNLEGGAIAPGDQITISSVPGIGMKAVGPALVIGYALEPYNGAEDRIDVFVNLGWSPAGKITADGTAVAVMDDLVVDRSDLVLRGTLDADPTIERHMLMQTAVVSDTDYRLSIRNAMESEVAYVSDDGAFSVVGDVMVGGHLYPSDRGVAQTNRYVFYDGSSGPGGDFMRTNAAGWATGSYDFAEMFPSTQGLKPGDVVVFAAAKESVEQSRESYSTKIAGVVSTRPGFLAGDNKAGDYPVALAGRVPTSVNNEGGAIEIGDPLTSSTTLGVAMKATKPGMIVGFAMEAFSGGQGSIVAFVRPQYWAGSASEAPATANRASGMGSSLSSLDLAVNFYAGGNSMLNVGTISGIGERWKITEEGDIFTQGLVTTTVRSYQDELKNTYATTSPEVYITLVGTTELVDGRVHVSFEAEDPSFNDVISNQVPVRVVATPSAAVSVYVENKNANGFDLVQVGGGMSGVSVDWYAIGYRKDVEPKKYLKLPDAVVPEPVAEEVEEGPVAEEVLLEEAAPGAGVPTDVVAEPGTEPTPSEPVAEEVPVIEEASVEEASVAEDIPAADVRASDESQQVSAETAGETLNESPADATE